MQTQIKLFSEIVEFSKQLEAGVQEPQATAQDFYLEKLLDHAEKVARAPCDLPNAITVFLCFGSRVEAVKMCRGALGNYFVFKKYADPVMGFPHSFITWEQWTTVRNSLMQAKYLRDDIKSFTHRGMRMLVFPFASHLPNLAVEESACPNIMC